MTRNTNTKRARRLWACPVCGLRTRGYGVASHQRSRNCWTAQMFEEEALRNAWLQHRRSAAAQERAHADQARRNIALRSAPSIALRKAALLPPELLPASGVAFCLTASLTVGVAVADGRVFFGQFNNRGRPVLMDPGQLSFQPV